MAAAFNNVTVSQKAVIEVGFQNTYKIMNVVGDDVSDYFRREMLDAVIDGIPVQGGPDQFGWAIDTRWAHQAHQDQDPK